MLIPITAMDLVRCSLRVKSAFNANTAAEIAPAPCTARPIINQIIEFENAAITLPNANTINPMAMTCFRLNRSDRIPEGI